MSKTRRHKPSSSAPSEDVPPRETPGWRFQFSLRTMLIATSLCCVLAAVWSGLLRAMKDPAAIDSNNLLFFLVLSVGAPVFMMMAASLIGPLRRLTARLRKPRDDS